MASLANRTGTLVDSGCKHIIPVVMATDHILQIGHGDLDNNTLLREKMRFCANRGDILLTVNRGLLKKNAGNFAKNSAYPLVVSSLTHVSAEKRSAIAAYCAGTFGIDGDQNVNAVVQQFLNDVPRFSFMGISLGLGYAHPSSGDTVVSSLIGGMATIQNGHFAVQTGDEIMWYWDFEEGFFDKAGVRHHHDRINQTDLPNSNNRMKPVGFSGLKRRRGLNDPDYKETRDTEGRMMMARRENGNIGMDANGNINHGKECVVYPKPFFMYADCARDNMADEDIHALRLDRLRVFGKAVGNARPFDKVDVLISI